ncbi:helix-turn-helix domain-containing protein [Variovorax sp. J31P207]|uniref:AraC-like ligand-binding domain-containing protein n=1 Tax=Variovorax sp. J31P207 TaxID=3053510 RepID=UPI0025752985|nr:helix-turn-helix domain-containing protein [Variovorax sp. J31P207]MDM0069956.1 helix-turn-helix domain-containing protein [Variovorax sp. J31P207]
MHEAVLKEERKLRTIYSTEDVDDRQRIAYWTDAINRTHCESVNEPLAALGFRALMSTTRVGDLSLSEIESDALTARRGSEEVLHSPSDDFVVMALSSGRACLEQGGRQVVQKANQMVIYDTARPFAYVFPERYKSTSARIPRKAMLSRVPMAERLTARVVDCSSPLAGLAMSLVRQASSLEPEEGRGWGPRVGASITDILGAALEASLAPGLTPGGRHQELLRRVKADLRLRLDDPDLDLESIASAHNVSSRTINRLFAADGTTAIRWLWQERLEFAYRQLSEGCARSVTDAALASGFSDFSHFSRSFAKRFGVCPGSLLRKVA